MIVRLFRVLSFGKLNTHGIGIRLVWYIVGSNGSLISICFCRTETFFTPTQVHASYTRTHVNHLIVEQRVRTKSSEEEKERKKEIVYCFFSVLVLQMSCKPNTRSRGTYTTQLNNDGQGVYSPARTNRKSYQQNHITLIVYTTHIHAHINPHIHLTIARIH